MVPRSFFSQKLFFPWLGGLIRRKNGHGKSAKLPLRPFFRKHWFFSSRLNAQIRRKITKANLQNCPCARFFSQTFVFFSNLDRQVRRKNKTKANLRNCRRDRLFPELRIFPTCVDKSAGVCVGANPIECRFSRFFREPWFFPLEWSTPPKRYPTRSRLHAAAVRFSQTLVFFPACTVISSGATTDANPLKWCYKIVPPTWSISPSKNTWVNLPR